MADLVIKNARLGVSAGHPPADLVVEDQKIVGIVAPGTGPSSSETLDAGGLLALPGIIDTHAHFREPGYEYKEDYETGSRAAAAGGITMWVDMPNLEPPPNTVERLRAQRDLASARSHVDFNHWASPTRIDEIPGIAAEGVPGFKFFMKQAHYPYTGEISITHHGEILETLRVIAGTGLVCVVHPHNQMLWEKRVDQRIERGWTDLSAWADATYGDDDVVETTAIATLALLAKAVGARLRILHIQGRPQLRVTRMMKENGFPFIAEANPWGTAPIEQLGLQDPGDLEANWEALRDGTIDLIASDHAPHTREEHESCQEDAFESVVAAYPLCEHWAALFLTAVNEGRLSLERFIELTSKNVAQHLGVYPRKGALQVGSDADVALVDMGREAVLGESYPVYSKMGFTPLEGRKVKGIPRYTVVRGTVVMAEGEVVGSPGYGEFIRAEPVTVTGARQG